ncbi:MAG: DUF1643 domain-containing protein [Oscillospiraceae bacterium]|nr:DUF1643 domain-containing protein [Oscillospiraceae bacterium]
MHVPSGASQTLDLLDFEQALALSGQGDSYDRTRWLYVPDFYADYRYILGTRGEHPLICIGINPSTAEPDRLDNTLKSVQRIAAGNGYDSFIMFNVYAQRATRPDDMDRELNELLHRENMRAFAYVLAQERAGKRPAVWAAWGAIIEKRGYLADCVRDMAALGERFDAEWLCAGPCSKRGHPHHPLYLKKDEKTRPFDVEAYLQTL